MNYENAIKGTNIQKRFKNFSLNVPELKIPKGFATALIGENGAGKSTLLRIINNVYAADEGQVLLDGVDVKNNDELKKKMVFDNV